MTPKLQKKLFEKYPKLFKQKDFSIKESCMPWGLEVPTSWYNIIDCLCWKIQTRIDNPSKIRKETLIGKLFGWLFKLLGLEYKTYLLCNKWIKENPSQIEFTQVKEKFGTLRAYYSPYDRIVEELISMAEALTGEICAECGSFKNVKSTKSAWIIYLCEDCMKKFKILEE